MLSQRPKWSILDNLQTFSQMLQSNNIRGLLPLFLCSEFPAEPRRITSPTRRKCVERTETFLFLSYLRADHIFRVRRKTFTRDQMRKIFFKMRHLANLAFQFLFVDENFLDLCSSLNHSS